MSDCGDTLAEETLRRLLMSEVSLGAAVNRPPGFWDENVWGKMSDLGMTSIAAEYEGGPSLLTNVLRELGRSAVVVPCLEHDFIGGWLLSQAGLQSRSSRLRTAALPETGEMSIRRERDGWVLDGKIKRVPFARYADEIVALAILGQDTWIVRIPTERLRLEAGLNLAGEPRDDIILDALAVDAAAVAALPPPVTATSIKARAALGRCFQMLGAMEGAMDLARRYAGTRSQFGRPLAQFQSIQNYLAEVAGEICAVGALVALAVQAGDAEIIDIAAAAKIRTGQAARIVAQRCHQIHGAIGLTHEYGLQLFTRRLWSWREEFGSEAYWADQLGDRLVASGAERLWETIAV